MITTEAILGVKRFATPLKLVGIGFLAYHCATTDVSFKPIWVAIYVGLTLLLANVCVAVEFLIDRLRPTNKKRCGEFTTAERLWVGRIGAQGKRLRRNPWLFLLIAGEDGFFFLPLLYLGITPVTAIAAAAPFTLLHYRDKPNSDLPATFLLSVANVLIVLPHGILPMVIGHYLLDATVIGMSPVLKKWVESDQRVHSLQSS